MTSDNRSATGLTAALGMLVAATGLATASPASAATEIIYGSYNPPSSTVSRFGAIPWLEEVQQKSNGSITYKFVGGGALVGTKTSLAGIRDGVVDAAMIVNLYYPTDIPVSNLLGALGSLHKDARISAAAVTEVNMLQCPECVKEMENFNIMFLGGYSTSAYNLLCSKPIVSLDDLKGKKIRAPGAMGRMASAIGAVPVNVTITETYEALQRGQVDCAFGSAGWLEVYSFGDVAKNVTMIRTGGTFGGPMLNISLDKWKALTSAERKILLDAAPVGVAGAAFGYENDDKAALAKANEKGYVVKEPAPDLTATVAAYSKADPAEVVKQATERGVKNA